MYNWDAKSQNPKWERFGLEGTAFITSSRKQIPHVYKLIILNKLGPDDFILNLCKLSNAKLEERYLMFKYSTEVLLNEKSNRKIDS